MNSESTRILIEDLGSGDALARYRAVDALSARRDETFAEILDLLSRGNPHQRAGAAEILERWRDPSAFDRLVTGTKDPDVSVRARCVEALGLLDAPRAQDSLLQAAQDAHPEVRAWAMDVLARLNSPGARSILRAALSDRDLTCAGTRSKPSRAAKAGARRRTLLQC